MIDRKELREQLDEDLCKLMRAVAQQLLTQVESGENLRAAIDFLRLNKRSVTEHDVIGSSKDPSDYLNGLLEDLGNGSGRNRQ